MSYQYTVRQQAGTRTADLRDAWVIAEAGGAQLFLIADGHSAAPGSGHFVRAILESVASGFRQLSAGDLSVAALEELTRLAQREQRRNFPGAAASVLAMLAHQGELYVMHWGDCCLGADIGERIEWLTAPHCIASAFQPLTHAELAVRADRHLLARSFTARRFVAPDVVRLSARDYPRVILATDGFWADLSDEQQQTLLAMGDLGVAPTDDDVTCMQLYRA